MCSQWTPIWVSSPPIRVVVSTVPSPHLPGWQSTCWLLLISCANEKTSFRAAINHYMGITRSSCQTTCKTQTTFCFERLADFVQFLVKFTWKYRQSFGSHFNLQDEISWYIYSGTSCSCFSCHISAVHWKILKNILHHSMHFGSQGRVVGNLR